MQVLLDFIRQINDDDGYVQKTSNNYLPQLNYIFLPLLCRRFDFVEAVQLNFIEWHYTLKIFLFIGRWKNNDNATDHLYTALRQWCFLFDSCSFWLGGGLRLANCETSLLLFVVLSISKSSGFSIWNYVELPSFSEAVTLCFFYCSFLHCYFSVYGFINWAETSNR